MKQNLTLAQTTRNRRLKQLLRSSESFGTIAIIDPKSKAIELGFVPLVFEELVNVFTKKGAWPLLSILILNSGNSGQVKRQLLRLCVYAHLSYDGYWLHAFSVVLLVFYLVYLYVFP